MKVNWQELRSFGISKYSKRYSPFHFKNGWFVSIVSVDNRNNMLHSICADYHGGWCIVAYVTNGFVRGRQQASGEASRRMRRNNEKPTRCSAAHFRRFLAHIHGFVDHCRGYIAHFRGFAARSRGFVAPFSGFDVHFCGFAVSSLHSPKKKATGQGTRASSVSPRNFLQDKQLSECKSTRLF